MPQDKSRSFCHFCSVLFTLTQFSTLTAISLQCLQDNVAHRKRLLRVCCWIFRLLKTGVFKWKRRWTSAVFQWIDCWIMMKLIVFFCLIFFNGCRGKEVLIFYSYLLNGIRFLFVLEMTHENYVKKLKI